MLICKKSQYEIAQLTASFGRLLGPLVYHLLVLKAVTPYVVFCFFFFSSRRRHTRLQGDWSSDVCSSDLWWADVERGALSRVTFDGDHRDPRWMRDGRAIVVASRGRGAFNLFERSVAENRSEERRVGKECRSRWSPYH